MRRERKTADDSGDIPTYGRWTPSQNAFPGLTSPLAPRIGMNLKHPRCPKCAFSALVLVGSTSTCEARGPYFREEPMREIEAALHPAEPAALPAMLADSSNAIHWPLGDHIRTADTTAAWGTPTQNPPHSWPKRQLRAPHIRPPTADTKNRQDNRTEKSEPRR